MNTTNTLRMSRAMFSERHGVPGDVNYYRWIEQFLGTQVVSNRKLLEWTPRVESSNCPILAEQSRRFAKFSPWQLHSVVRNVFIGRIPSLRAGALAHDAFGHPPFVVAISDGMYSTADQCIYLWESVVRLLSEAEEDLRRGGELRDVMFKLNEKITAHGLEDRVEKIVSKLRYAFREGNIEQLLKLTAADVELPITGVPRSDLRHRSRRQYAWEQFVIAHELAHIILGHLGPTGSPTASRYAQDAIRNYRILSTWDRLTDHNQHIEAEADLFGLFDLSYATSWEMSRRDGVRTGWQDRSQLSLLVQYLDGVAIAILVFYLLSALGFPAHPSTHPHPDHRLALIAETMLTRMKAIISTTNEPNVGQQDLPGFYERVLSSAERVPRVYRTIANALDLALERSN